MSLCTFVKDVHVCKASASQSTHPLIKSSTHPLIKSFDWSIRVLYREHGEWQKGTFAVTAMSLRGSRRCVDIIRFDTCLVAKDVSSNIILSCTTTTTYY